jgi:hypothetical protein
LGVCVCVCVCVCVFVCVCGWPETLKFVVYTHVIGQNPCPKYRIYIIL